MHTGWTVFRVYGESLERPYSESKLVLEFKEEKTIFLVANFKNVTFLFFKKIKNVFNGFRERGENIDQLLPAGTLFGVKPAA